MPSNPNRNRGHNFERDIVRELKELGYDAVSSRYESRRLDDAGVDIVTDAPYMIQCKCSINQPNIDTLLTETEADTLFYRRVEKKGTRFYAKNDYVCIPKARFYELIKQRK